MNTIKNLHKLSGVFTPEQIERLEKAANLHLRLSNITFKIIKIYDDEIHVRTEQGKHLSENYATKETLITRTRELFAPFTRRTIFTHPVPYQAAVVDIVTPEWLAKEQLNLGIKVKDLVFHTGIDKSNISAWINGVRHMSQIVKAMFFNVVKLYALKDLVEFLNKDVEYSSTFTIKKWVNDDGLVKKLVESNQNASRYVIRFYEGDDHYAITLRNPSASR